MKTLTGNGLITNNKEKAMDTQNIAETGRKATSDMKKAANRAIDKAEDVASDLGHRFQDRFHDLGENAMVARETAEKYVRKHPLSWVLGAAAAGLVLGVVVNATRNSFRQ